MKITVLLLLSILPVTGFGIDIEQELFEVQKEANRLVASIFGMDFDNTKFDYEEELIEHVITPCFKHLHLPYENIVSLEQIMDRHGDRFYEHVKGMNLEMNLMLPLETTFEQRKELYQMTLNSCLFDTNLTQDEVDIWAEEILMEKERVYKFERYGLYFLLYFILSLWVVYDARKRKNNMITWPIATALFGLVSLPVYLAKRNLLGDETREGGLAWNTIKYFVLFWTLTITIDGIHAIAVMSEMTDRMSPGLSDFGEAIAIGAYVFVWFVVVILALILGSFLKKNVIEKSVSDSGH